MAKDPAFLFYPGDYLRDTQCLSEPVQVAYDRIICEHMRNICIRQDQLNFFTKRLSETEKAELMMVLEKCGDDFRIPWVAESISKRRSYSESRRENRAGKPKEHMNNISKSYDSHMEIENINENEIDKTIEYVRITGHRNLSKSQVEEYWKAFLIHKDGIVHLGHPDKIRHFRNWIKTQKDATSINRSTTNSKSAGANEVAERLASKLAARGTSDINR